MTEQTQTQNQANQFPVESPWVKAFVMSLLAGIAANTICYILARFLGHLLSWEILAIALAAGAVATRIVWTCAKNHPRYRELAAAMGFAVAIVTYTVGTIFFTPRIVKTWDFEDGTAQGWGIYDEEKGRVIHSADVIQSQKFAKGDWSLEVNSFDIRTSSSEGKPALKKWPAVYYADGLSKAKVTASVYIPSSADYRFADVKFFLFAGGKWEWHDSGRGTHNEGELLLPGKWVEVSWDLRPHKTRRWSSPWPWRNIFGIQVYVEGQSFTGPVYIDNISLSK